MAPAPNSFWSSSILSPQGTMFCSSGSPEVRGVMDAHLTSGSHTCWSHHQTSLITSRRLFLPSLCWRCSGSCLLILCPVSNLFRSHSVHVFRDRCFSPTSSEQGASCSNLFYMIWWRREEGHFLLPSAMSQWLARAVTDTPLPDLSFLGPWSLLLSVLPLKLLPGEQRLDSSIARILDWWLQTSRRFHPRLNERRESQDLIFTLLYENITF